MKTRRGVRLDRFRTVEESAHYSAMFYQQAFKHAQTQTRTNTHTMYCAAKLAIINHKSSPCIVVKAFCEWEDNNGKLRDKLRNIITSL